MKKHTTVRYTAFIVIMVLGLLAAECSCDKGSSSAKAVSTTKATFAVKGMHCSTCPITVRTAAKGVPGVTGVRVSLAEGKAWVTYDPKRTTPARIAAAITSSGYKATPVQ